MKSIIRGDLTYIFSKKKNIIVIFNILMLSIFIFTRNTQMPPKYILGLDLTIENTDLITVFSYLLNVVTYIYIFVFLLEKDLKNMFPLLFTRMSMYKWLIIKIISYIIIILIMKSIEYIIFILLYNSNLSLVLNYYIHDISYSLLVMSLVLLTCLFRKKEILFYIILILNIILIPKCIITNLYYLIFITIMDIIIILFSYFKNNKFLYLIGGFYYDRSKKYN